MNIPKNEIRVYYKNKDRIVEAWDSVIEAALSGLGFERWASGYDYTTEVRDLAFKEKKHQCKG